MTNNDTATIALTAPGHGLFKVHTSHLTEVIVSRFDDTAEDLLREVNYLVGEALGYEDLDRASLLVLVSYLTGGIAD